MSDRLQLKNVQHDFETRVGEVGVTVRRGFKWAIEPGAALELWLCDVPHQGACPHWDLRDASKIVDKCRFRGTAHVVSWWVGKLKSLPASVIELEHESSSRLYTGLLASLRRAYGTGLTEDEYVTALFYMRETVEGELG